MRRLGNTLALLGAMAALMAGCSQLQPPVNRVGVNVVEKSAFTGSWYMHSTVIQLEYAAAPLDYVGNNAGDSTAGFLGVTIPRIRWVIDENYLYAYRDYELIGDSQDPLAVAGDSNPNYLGQPVAVFKIESHFDIRRLYNSVSGEEQNVIVENTQDRRWYERQFMRVDWSANLIAGYYGTTHNLPELFGCVQREAANYVQDVSGFPSSWRPQFHFMSCDGADDTGCAQNDRDWARDYSQGDLYSMSFVTQEIVSPNLAAPYSCWSMVPGMEPASVAVWVRTSFLRVSDRREYVAENWDNDRFNRAGFFALDRLTYDRSTSAGDPSYGFTDFTNKSMNRHNLWTQWYQHDANDNVVTDADGNPQLLPYDQREVRPIVWHTSSELPAHLIKPGFQVVGDWNRVFMRTVRQLQGKPLPSYAPVTCQRDNPTEYCYCQDNPDGGGPINPTCPGRYDPFQNPADLDASTNAYDCYAALTDGDGNVVGSALMAEPDYNDAAINDASFANWFNVRMVGSECVNMLRVNTCNQGNKADWDNLDCQQRGDIRFKLLSFVTQPGTPFLGVAQMRGDPLTGEVLTGDANIGGPAMNSQRTFAMQTYDLINGNISPEEFYTGEDLRAFLNSAEHVELPATPNIDFSVALRAGLPADPGIRSSIDNVMARTMERAGSLHGPSGGASSMWSRLGNLAGTDIERRLVSGYEAYAMAGISDLPQNATPDQVPESVLDRASPFRRDFLDLMQVQSDFNTRLGLANMMLPNEYTDDSVLWYVNEHRDWSRAHVEFELNRRLYMDTQVHEMGHCLGLRHHFGGTADPSNFFDGYFYVNDQFQMPDPNAYDIDGTPGLSPAEHQQFEADYRSTKHKREISGIDQWMTSSVMDYTPNWYQRLHGAAPYDYMAISFGYGDIVDIYHNVADGQGNSRPAKQVQEIHRVNTQRVGIKYYHGGEVCMADSDCPFSASGPRAAELMDSNMGAGLTQHCVMNPNDTGASVCSNFDDDSHAVLSSYSSTDTPEWVPVEYFYCEDLRAQTRTLAGCAVFDEGDSFREIVRNQEESYERDYIFSAFRRYRRTFSINRYVSRLFRFVDPLLGIYQNLVARYASDPAFRSQQGPFGFYDEFLATADIMNFFARMMSQPSLGSYNWNAGWNYYEETSLNATPTANMQLPLGTGRYLTSTYQSGLTGINRVERVGSIYDAIIAMQLLTARGLGVYYGADAAFLTNFYDLFPSEMEQIFTGMLSATPEAYMPRVNCAAGSTFPDCNDPQIVYMDFYRGDCSVDPATGTVANPDLCRPNPAEVTYAGLPVVNGGTYFYLQSYAAIFALAGFPVYFDTSFENQVYVCVEGQGDCFAPAGSAVEGTDYVRYTSRRYGQSFLAWQVDTSTGTGQSAVGFAMVNEAKGLDIIIRALRYYEGDFESTAVAPDPSFVPAALLAEVTALGYELPVPGEIANEITRLDTRLNSLESFFYYLIQLEQEYGIQFPFLYTRPEI